ncbi:GTPBP1 family GTP-binding protein [Methanothermobacter sp.]|uniref:GTPBP1 family GTP-binding protein n=1 Tax=Methanothermobacter sp. TaxID=1884223 RepID=UPI003C75D66E
MIEDIRSFTSPGERRNIEFKKALSPGYHLKMDRKKSLISQMKYRMERGGGRAVYLLGVEDSGEPVGLPDDELRESVDVIRKLSQEIDAVVEEVNLHEGSQGRVAEVIISRKQKTEREHLLIGVAGHVDHGKSTLLGTLTTGTPDDGSGKTRIFLDVQKHEIERGLSADLSFAIYGFRNGRVIRLKNPLDRREKSGLMDKADRVISFVDTVGHEPWLRTTIRGIVGQNLDYGLLTVAADEGPTHITREHLGIMIAMELPVIVVLTKTDMATPSQRRAVREKISELLKLVGRIPFHVREMESAGEIAGRMNQHIVPIIEASSVTGEGLEVLDELFLNLEVKRDVNGDEKPFLMYIDKIYTIRGVGTVVSGTIQQGLVRKGDTLLLGPLNTGKFREVTVKSIEMHHYRIGCAEPGHIVGISISGASADEIERGMILAHPDYEPEAVREFEAEVAILVHPTTIKAGYESVTHIETIAETTILEPIDAEFMSAGDRGRVRMRFKYRPHHVREGQKIIFREGRSKGIGSVTRILE